MGICVENGKNIFITDAQVGAVKLITDVECAVKFLENLEKQYQAFSVHQKHKRTHTSTLQEAGEMMKSVSGYLQGTVQSVKTLLGNSKETNGPEGTVASKTIRSVNMINQGLARLQSNIAKINPKLTVNPEALLTMKVENLHAVSNFKHPTCMQLHYARDFENQQSDAVVRFLLHTLNIILSCTLDTNSSSRFSKDDTTKPACHEFS